MKALNILNDLWSDESGGSSILRFGLGLAGAGAGFLIGGPFGAAAFGAQMGFLGGSLLGNILFPQTLPDIVGSRLDPNKLMVSAYGAPIPIGFGQFVVGSVVAYYPGFVEHEITEELGGKMGPTQARISYTYTGSFRVNFCEGPADAILKMWANRILIYDATNTTEPIVDLARLERAPGANAIRLYLGTETQLSVTTEQADKGVDATPAYRGIVGAFFQNYPLDDSGGVPPQITALIAMKASEILPLTTLTGSAGDNHWEWQPGKQTFLNSNTSRISNANQQILKTGGFGGSDPNFPCVDSEGNFYRVRDGFGDPEQKGGRITKVSGETLNALLESERIRNPFTDASIGGSLNWSHGRVFGGVRTPEGDLVGEMLYVQRNSGGANSWTGVFALDRLLDRGAGCVNYFYTGTHFNKIQVDSERFLWTAATSGANTILTRINPGSGILVETYTITGETFDQMTYDPVTNSLILGNGSNGMVRWGLDSQTIDERDDSFTYTTSSDKNDSVFWNGPNSDGTMYIQVGATLGGFQEYNVHTMSEEPRVWSPNGDWGLGSSDVHRGMMDESRNAMMKRDDGGKIHWLYFDRVTGDPITVEEIVEFICLRVGFAASQFNATNLTQQLHGYLIQSRVAANTALAPLRRFFFFNPISEDFQVKFPVLGSSSVATILEDHLAAGDDGEVRVEVDKLVEELISEMELPEVLEMESAGENRDYQAQIQIAKWPRSTTNSRRRRFLSFPGTFITDADAAQRLQMLLYQIVNKRRPVTIRTSQRWLKLSPADVITVQAEGLSHQIIIGQIDQGANNVLEIRGAADDPQDLISVATGFSGTIPDQTISSTATSQFFILDIALLRDQDDGFGIYIGGAPFNNSTGWRGEEIVRSVDGMDYSSFAYIPGSRAADHGFTTTIPDNADDGVWDRDTSINITMTRGTLPSTTEALAVDGAGLLLVGNELLCYVTSVDNGNGSYTVSTLLRGRGGTEGEIANHVAEERVVVISADTLIRKAMDLSDQGDPFFYKGVTRGGSLNDALRKIRTVLGKSQWTWAPVHITGSISANDWTVNWTWRNRINGRWRDLLGIAAPGTFDYEVDVLSGPGGTVLATYTSTASANGSVVTGLSHQFFYDNADQAVDFGDAQTTVTFKIYPISIGGIGRGFPTEVTLVGG